MFFKEKKKYPRSDNSIHSLKQELMINIKV